jgi:hypothetical protein
VISFQVGVANVPVLRKSLASSPSFTAMLSYS